MKKTKDASSPNLSRTAIYPLDLCRFDNVHTDDQETVRDPKIRSKLKEQCEDAKILWEAIGRSRLISLDGKNEHEVGFGNSPIVFVVHLHLTLLYAKLLAGEKSRLTKHRYLIRDRQSILNFYMDHFQKTKVILTGNRNNYDIALCHPFAQHISRLNHEGALKMLQDDEYKKKETLFIRTSNADRKLIVDTIVDVFNKSKNIIVHRLDVTNGIRFDNQDISTNEFKLGLNVVLNRVTSVFKGNLLCAIHSISPSALSKMGLHGYSGKIGHLVLILSKNAEKQATYPPFSYSTKLDKLTEGTALSLSNTLLPAAYSSKAIGVMRSTDQQSLFALGQLADYMTLERRYVKPGARGAPEPEKPKRQHTLFIKHY